VHTEINLHLLQPIIEHEDFNLTIAGLMSTLEGSGEEELLDPSFSFFSFSLFFESSGNMHCSFNNPNILSSADIKSVILLEMSVSYNSSVGNMTYTSLFSLFCSLDGDWNCFPHSFVLFSVFNGCDSPPSQDFSVSSASTLIDSTFTPVDNWLCTIMMCKSPWIF
jgi:hypothetical protein